MASESGSTSPARAQPESSWRPLLSGWLAERAHAVLVAIDMALSPLLSGDDPAFVDAAGESSPIARRLASLAHGEAGISLYHAYRWLATRSPAAAAAADRHLNHALAIGASTTGAPSLFEGVTGLAWTFEHLKSRLPLPPTDPALLRQDEAGCGREPRAESDLCSNISIEEVLIRMLERDQRASGGAPPLGGASPMGYGLASGLSGLGVYALERLPHERAATLLTLVIDRLATEAEVDEIGVSWRTAATDDPAGDSHGDDSRPDLPDLGVANGAAGVIGMLASALAAGIAPPLTRALLTESVAWLIAHRRPPTRGAAPPPHRLTWCDGDPGIAAALLHASRSAGRRDWADTAITIALAAASTTDEPATTPDLGFCHGAAGRAHLFNRLYQATGNEPLAEASRHWFTRLLDTRRPGEGIAGFTAHRPRSTPGSPDTTDQSDPVADPGLLNGAAGIGLALLAAATPIDPLWDRVLLAHLTPRPIDQSSPPPTQVKGAEPPRSSESS